MLLCKRLESGLTFLLRDFGGDTANLFMVSRRPVTSFNFTR